jgi:hypothetical protein
LVLFFELLEKESKRDMERERREGKGREGKGREGKGREGKEREGRREERRREREGYVLCQAEDRASFLRRASIDSWGPPCEQKAH